MTILRYLFKKVRQAYRFLRLLQQFLKKEIELHGALFTPGRLKYVLRGFHSDKKFLYEHDSSGMPLGTYLTDFERLRTKYINSSYKDALDNKILFTQVFSPFFSCPINFGFLEEDGRYTPIDQSTRTLRNHFLEEVVNFLPDDFVMKRVGGGGGKDIYLVKKKDSKFYVNGVESSVAKLKNVVGNRRFLMMELISQGKYARELYPNSVNTVRVVSAVDNNGPWIAFAAQRIGRHESAPMDNFNQGGICSQVDLETGEIGSALYYSGDSKPTFFLSHPDTKVQIKDKVIPHWNEIKSSIIRACAQYQGFVYVGWDVVILDDGFMVLEGNSYPGVQVLQLHEPLLIQKRLIKLYGRKGVLSASRLRQLGVDPDNNVFSSNAE